jgi:hypothetical protein
LKPWVELKSLVEQTDMPEARLDVAAACGRAPIMPSVAI